MLPAALDAWLPDPAIRSHHRKAVAAEPATAWAAAHEVLLSDTLTLGRLVRWRIPDTPAGETFDGLLRTYPFTVLEQGELFSVSGLCGRIWTLHRDYPHLRDPADFRAWDEPGTVRVLFAHWVEPAPGDGNCTLVSEARIAPTDRHAALRLKALWAVVGPFERLVGAEALAAAQRRARRATTTA
jgi:hypothetical protein